ncbi:MAG: Xaa-Pro peptidase family protein [Alphaproteobacteria bacterium]
MSGTADLHDMARNTPGGGIKDYEGQIDMVALRAWRLGRVQAELKRRDLAGIVLSDFINIRYATGARNWGVWSARLGGRYAWIPAEGKATLFEVGRVWAADGLESIGEVRQATNWIFWMAGPDQQSKADAWAAELADLISAGGANRRVAFDRLDPMGLAAVHKAGLEYLPGEELMARARLIKGPQEIQCMNISLAVCDIGIARMKAALKPGITENALWSHLHQANIEHGGEWIEARLLASGGRTNPWGMECGDRMIRPGDLVAFDTDMIGPFGYCADVSRTFFCGPGKPSDEQKTMYRLAHEQIYTNLELMRAGLTFREVSERSWRAPNQYAANAMFVLHGVGLEDEYPSIPTWNNVDRLPEPEARLESGMTLCLEAYIGAEHGAEGIKLEEQILITDSGPQILSLYPFEDELMS